jgi:hypothetical protein
MRKSITLALIGFSVVGISAAASAQQLGLSTADFQRQKAAAVESLGAQAPTADLKLAPAASADPLAALSSGRTDPSAASSPLNALGTAMSAPMGPGSGASLSMALPTAGSTGLSAATAPAGGSSREPALSVQAESLGANAGPSPMLGLAGGNADTAASLSAMVPTSGTQLGR